MKHICYASVILAIFAFLIGNVELAVWAFVASLFILLYKMILIALESLFNE